MKKIFVILLVVTVFTACDNEELADTRQLVFHVQSDFSNDEVKITVDGQEILNKMATTNHLLGVDPSANTSVDLIKGTHSVGIVVDGHGFMTDVVLDSDLYVGINYNRDTNEIFIVQSLQPFGYD
jgi:hypothetical protein